MDLLAQILWYMIFFTPLITIPIAWRFKDISRTYRIILGLLLALVLSIALGMTSAAIIFRDGMGPI